MFLQLSGQWLYLQRHRLLYPWVEWALKSQSENPGLAGWHPGETVKSHWADAWVCFSLPGELRYRQKTRVEVSMTIFKLSLKTNLKKKQQRNPEHHVRGSSLQPKHLSERCSCLKRSWETFQEGWEVAIFWDIDAYNSCFITSSQLILISHLCYPSGFY